jgi:hypothetical protein
LGSRGNWSPRSSEPLAKPGSNQRLCDFLRPSPILHRRLYPCRGRRERVEDATTPAPAE